METAGSESVENSEQMMGWPSVERRPISSSRHVIRSYECSFCKRGFSNAQALGGHMNIHRKDRIKAMTTKQQPPANYSSVMITEINNSCSDIPDPVLFSTHHDNKFDLESYSSSNIEELITHVDVVPLRQLIPLFAQNIPSNCSDDPKTDHHDIHDNGGWCEDKQMQYWSHAMGSREDQLDLELRLGPHQPGSHHRTSSTSTGTLDFF